MFLVNTSFSSVTNPNDLKIFLSNRIMEIKAICAHFELDFESLNSGGDNGCSGLDMSIIESKVQDHTDSVAGSGFDKKLATIAQDHVPIALNQFNDKAIELNFLELVDKFLMEEGSFVRFEGHNPFCSASITGFEHSIRLYLMTLHSKQVPRYLNRKSTGRHYAIQIMEQFNHLIKC